MDRRRPSLRPRLHAGSSAAKLSTRSAASSHWSITSPTITSWARASPPPVTAWRSAPEVVETNIAAYGLRGFFDHQLRWARTVRDARPWGYAGLIFTHGLCWALLNVIACGLCPLSLWLLGLSFCLRLTLAMTVGAEVLSDRQVLPNLWLLPLRDLVAMAVWIAGFAGNTIVWRGERFTLKDGKMQSGNRID